MKKFMITNADNTKMSVDLIRYFSFKNDNFLIYSIGEIDEKGYLKLYLVRIMEELGFPVAQTIRNEADWSNMQGIVKKVLKELKKNNKKTMTDLNYKEIEGIKISNPRFFKLDPNLANILSSNYFDEESVDEDPNKLESIDQTILKESTFNPVGESVEDNNTNDGMNDAADNLVNADLNNNENNAEERNTVITNDNAIEVNAGDEMNSDVSKPVVDSAMIGSAMITNDLQPVPPLPDYEAEIVPNVEITPITPVTSNEIDNQLRIEDVNVSENSEIKPIEIEPNANESVSDNSETNINNVSINDTNINNVNTNINNTNAEPNYKELYDSLKADNDATNALLNELMVELGKYKEKYGEL